MSATTYVPQDRSIGVPVYDYRVAAGIFPSHHYLVNAHHGSTRVSVDPLRGLRPDQKRRLNLEPISYSNAFLNAYSLSGGTVHISGAEEGISERHMIPDRFSPEQVRRVEPEGEDDYRREMGFLAGEGEAPQRIWPLQWEGVRRYAETEGTGSIGQPLADRAVIDELRAGHTTSDGRLQLSASRLRTYLSCPQRYLLSYLLGLEEPDNHVTPEAVTPLDEGNLIHEILRMVHRQLQEGEPTVGPREMSDLVSRGVSDTIEAWGKRALATPALLLELLRERLGREIAGVLDWEEREFSGSRPYHVEAWLDAPVGDKVLLRGSIDLSLGPEDSLTLVDFKRGTIPKKRALEWTGLTQTDIAALAEQGWNEATMDIQLPVYTLLVQRNGCTVSEGYFYSIRDRKAVAPLSTAVGRTPEEAVAAVETIGVAAARRILSGAFEIPDNGQGCGRCAFRGICRAKFVSEEHNG